ncbi:YndJ family transporter [Streptomyces bacillaris]
MTVLVNVIVMVGMLLVVPAGLRLTGLAELDRIRRLWPLFAAPGAVALWLPRGPTAAALALCYALGAVLLALHAPRRALRGRDRSPAGIALLTALVTPAVAALALVAERRGHELFGFGLEILALTVPHFHFAGFAAALVAGLVCRVDDGPAGRFAALSVPAVGEATGLPHPTLTWMAATHGLGNALGFALCSLLAWHRIRTLHPSESRTA